MHCKTQNFSMDFRHALAVRMATTDAGRSPLSGAEPSEASGRPRASGIWENWHTTGIFRFTTPLADQVTRLLVHQRIKSRWFGYWACPFPRIYAPLCSDLASIKHSLLPPPIRAFLSSFSSRTCPFASSVSLLLAPGTPTIGHWHAGTASSSIGLRTGSSPVSYP